MGDMAQKASEQVECAVETVQFPTEFERSDFTATSGHVPESFEADFAHVVDGDFRIAAYVGEDRWVEVAPIQTESDETLGSDPDWFAFVVLRDSLKTGREVWRR